tara:strand:- start:51 stop:647 length:597 start_codon:yes stop_codon:yes gene_type:complete
MKNITNQNMIEIYNREKLLLENAIKNGNNPYHIFALSTNNINIPESRMVVLRNIQFSPFKIYFNIDIRSPKAYQLKHSDYCTALFYNQERRVQMRFLCKPIIHNQNKVTKKVWSTTPLQSRKCYMGPYTPSKKINEWHPNVPIEYIDRDPELNDSNQGYKHFSHIELIVEKIDVLELHHDGHIRFCIDKKQNMYFVSP